MGGSKQTQTQSTKESVGPWQPAQGALTDILGQAHGLLGNAGINPTEDAALSGLASNAQGFAGYSPQLQQLTDRLFAGGGFGQGNPALQQAWQTLQSSATPIATGNLDPTQNPQMQQMIQQITDQARNAVGSQFAGAGRSFSGAHADATGRAITQGLAPTLFNQYNQNVQNALGAGGQLMSGASTLSGGLDSSAGQQLGAQMAAPGSIDAQNTPQYMQLAAEAQRRGIPLQNLSDINSLVLPIAQAGREGTSSGTTTQQTKSSPLQTAVGGGLGILGTLGQSGAFGPAGWLF